MFHCMKKGSKTAANIDDSNQYIVCVFWHETSFCAGRFLFVSACFMQIAKALTSLHTCAGCSKLLLFAYNSHLFCVTLLISILRHFREDTASTLMPDKTAVIALSMVGK